MSEKSLVTPQKIRSDHGGATLPLVVRPWGSLRSMGGAGPMTSLATIPVSEIEKGEESLSPPPAGGASSSSSSSGLPRTRDPPPLSSVSSNKRSKRHKRIRRWFRHGLRNWFLHRTCPKDQVYDIKGKPSSQKARRLSKTQRLAIAIGIVSVCAAIIGIGLFVAKLRGAGPVNLGSKSLLSAHASPLVVTSVHIVQSSSREKALEKCNDRPGFVPVGVNLHGDDKTAFAFICQQQRPLFELDMQDQVLQQLLVLNQSTCGSTSSSLNGVSLFVQPIFAPKKGSIVVCASFVSRDQAMHSAQFIRSISVAYESTQLMRGWSQISDQSISFAENYNIFLVALELPIPLAELRVLPPALRKYSILDDPCDQFGMRFTMVKGFTLTSNTQDVLCVARADYSTWSNELSLLQEPYIADLELIRNGSVCTNSSDEQVQWQTFVESYPLPVSETFVICVHKATGIDDPATKAFVNDMYMSTKPNEKFNSASGTPAIVGSWRFLGHLQLFVTKNALMESIGGLPLEDGSQRELVARVESNSHQQLVFRIVQFADLHVTGALEKCPCSSVPKHMTAKQCSERLTLAFMKQVLDAEKPDLVVFTGDNVNADSYELSIRALDLITELVDLRGIPFALVFGNHDQEFELEDWQRVKSNMMQFLVANKRFFVGEIGPRQVAGVGNYVVQVVNPQQPKQQPVLSLFFLDSHGVRNDTQFPQVDSMYQWMDQSQLDFFLQQAHRIKTNVPAGGPPPVGLMFFHIPVPEISLDSASIRNGIKQDDAAVSRINSQLTDLLVQLNQVKAVFFGHDHLNEYCYARQGIQLCYGGFGGFGRAYGSANFAHRTRVIEWRQDMVTNRQEIRSWKRHYDNFASRQTLEILYTSES